MVKPWNAVAALALAVVITAVSALGADEIDTSPAMAAAQAWLNHVDSGRYGESWDESSAFFREKVAKVEWQTKLDDVRAPMGILVTRKIRKATYVRNSPSETPALPGAPDGEYVVIQFDSSFERYPRATETVTPMREKDGSWKVSGYFIR